MIEDNFDEIMCEEDPNAFNPITYICNSCSCEDNIPTWVIDEERDFLKFCGEKNKEPKFECPNCGETMIAKS